MAPAKASSEKVKRIKMFRLLKKVIILRMPSALSSSRSRKSNSMQMAYTRKKRLKTKRVKSGFQDCSETIIGKIVVTYIHTNARKIVLPNAAFRNARRYGWDSFGAE